MDSRPEDPHQSLLQLLALKRHEVPPPGFFDRLPRRILANIRAGSQIAERTWWQRVLETITQAPMVAGSYAALGVGALLFGVSVFQMAIESDSPASPSYSAAATLVTDPVVLVPANLPGGVIYRVDPDAYSTSPSPVMGPTPFQANLLLNADAWPMRVSEPLVRP